MHVQIWLDGCDMIRIISYIFSGLADIVVNYIVNDVSPVSIAGILVADSILVCY